MTWFHVRRDELRELQVFDPSLGTDELLLWECHSERNLPLSHIQLQSPRSGTFPGWKQAIKQKTSNFFQKPLAFFITENGEFKPKDTLKNIEGFGEGTWEAS